MLWINHYFHLDPFCQSAFCRRRRMNNFLLGGGSRICTQIVKPTCLVVSINTVPDRGENQSLTVLLIFDGFASCSGSQIFVWKPTVLYCDSLMQLYNPLTGLQPALKFPAIFLCSRLHIRKLQNFAKFHNRPPWYILPFRLTTSAYQRFLCGPPQTTYSLIHSAANAQRHMANFSSFQYWTFYSFPKDPRILTSVLGNIRDSKPYVKIGLNICPCILNL